jgi:hypothetical protein
MILNPPKALHIPLFWENDPIDVKVFIDTFLYLHVFTY